MVVAQCRSELLHMLHKMMHADTLGFLKHVCDSCSAALLGSTVRRWNITQLSNDLRESPLGPFLERPCRSV
jgi:hypothetical protein